MRYHIRTVMYIMMICVLLAVSASASGIPFSSDVEAINMAAQSVLMLEVYDANDEMIGTGSGFVAFDNYTLVTNEHVIQDAAIIIGKSDDGNQYMLTKLISADAKKDIAILEFFSPTNLSPLALNDQGKVQRAESVVAIGSPLGHKNSVSLGNISTLYEEDEVSLIQFTAPISQGSSGGALFNDRGQVIGITSGSFTEGQNINLAISIEEILDLYKTSHTNERINLSNYKTASSTLNVTATPTPTEKPTVKPTNRPTATPYPLEGFLDFLDFMPSNEFNYSVLKEYQGYKYDRFSKSWNYSRVINLSESIFLRIYILGDKYIYHPPEIFLSFFPEKRSGAFVNSIDILVGDMLYTFKNLRYLEDNESSVFFYLGSIGRQMVEDIPKAKTISFRLTFRDNRQSTYELKSQTFSPLSVWCKNIIKHKVFELFQPQMLTYADKAHNATVN